MTCKHLGPFLLTLLLSVTTHGLAAQTSTALAPKEGLDRFVRVYDTKKGEEIRLGTMVERLAAMDAVFLGETHLDETTHQVELDVYRRLISVAGKKVILAMEMFTTADQPALDDYLRGKTEEKEFRRKAMVWGNYQTGYRPMIELAKAKGLPVVGSNIPTSLRRKIGRGKKKAWDELTPEEKKLVPDHLYPNSLEYWKRFNRVVGGHMAGFDKIEDPSAEKFLYFGQTLWDNTMAWSCSKTLAENPGSLVLHVNGGFHTSRRQGTVQQFKRRSPKAKVATVDISSASGISGITHLESKKAQEIADFIVYTKRRGWGKDEGMNAVHTARRLRFKISMPDTTAKGAKVPLLIWLSGDGYRAEDGLRYWQLALGDEAAVLSVEPPYPQVEEDYRLGGRWFWKETYQSDLNESTLGLEEIRRYALAYWPVDPDRVLLAGIGTGATTLAAAGLYSDELPHDVLAIHPRAESKLRERGIPEEAPDRTKVLVFPTGDRLSWWKGMIDSFNKEGYAAEVRSLEGEGGMMGQIERMIRARLAIPAPKTKAPEQPRRHILVQASRNPIGGYWAMLHKRALEKRGVRVRITDLSGLQRMSKADFAGAPTVQILGFEGEAWVTGALRMVQGSKALGIAGLAKSAIIPPAKGPFGGTTILVLPKWLSEKAKKAWQDVEKTNPLRFQGRFYRLLLAYEDGSPSLSSVLAESKNKGRNNLLVLPATYCWDGDQMRQLKRSAGAIPSGLSITWFPGLGARMYKRVQ